MTQEEINYFGNQKNWKLNEEDYGSLSEYPGEESTQIISDNTGLSVREINLELVFRWLTDSEMFVINTLMEI